MSDNLKHIVDAGCPVLKRRWRCIGFEKNTDQQKAFLSLFRCGSCGMGITCESSGKATPTTVAPRKANWMVQQPYIRVEDLRC
jgi:hypothetical protein